MSPCSKRGFDGRIGPAWDFVQISVEPKLPWGVKVSPAFKRRVIEISTRLGIDPAHLMACMAFESDETFSPAVKNKAHSGGTGLIQFMPTTATALGTTTGALASMTPEAQLQFVERFLAPHRGRLRTLEDLYMAILWPKAIGHPPSFVLLTSPSKEYAQNQGLDHDHSLTITKFEAAASIRAKLTRGMRFAG